MLGVSVKTLHRWDESGKIKAKRTPSNHRYYTEDDVAVAKGLKPEPSHRKIILRLPSIFSQAETGTQKPTIFYGAILRSPRVWRSAAKIACGLKVDE